VAQIILRWLTQRGVVAIPKSVRPERIAENFAVFDVELSPDEMAAIATLDTKTSSFFDHRDPKMVKMLGEAKRPT
jgi:2,5-diketo-D-gluconate reductase A